MDRVLDRPMYAEPEAARLRRRRTGPPCSSNGAMRPLMTGSAPPMRTLATTMRFDQIGEAHGNRQPAHYPHRRDLKDQGRARRGRSR